MEQHYKRRPQPGQQVCSGTSTTSMAGAAASALVLWDLVLGDLNLIACVICWSCGSAVV